MKKEYNLKDTVWIHMGEQRLVQGRVVEILDLDHLNEGYDPDLELYVIEIPSGIDLVYEVRTFGLISPDATGPINAFRREGLAGANRFLKKIGMPVPQGVTEWQTKTESSSTTSSIVTPNTINKNKNQKRRFYRKKPKQRS
jgi:hypothetical protein